VAYRTPAAPIMARPVVVVSGPAGPDGPVGPTGPGGAAGGPTGPTGAGLPGATGPAGAQGSPGVTGPAGPQGSAGMPGSPGSAGATGPTGTQGTVGTIGATGPAGAQGSAGTPGTPGAVGATGPAGAQGAAGTVGATGPTGLQGSAGTAGGVGATGPTGTAGAVGVATATPPLNLAGSTLSIDLSAYAPLASPTFTGDPKAPTPTAGDNDTSIATTAFVTTKAANYLPLIGGTLTGNLTITSAGALAVQSTIAASSPTTGALTVAGGAGIGGALVVGTDFACGGATPALAPGVGNTNTGMLVANSIGAFLSISRDPSGGVIYCNMNGTGGALYIHQCAGVNVGNITVTPTATAYNTGSDGRLKTDLRPFDAGPIIDKLMVFDFAWRSSGERAFGVAAQEAAEVYPQAVTYKSEGDWWGTDYSKFVPLLLQEIKALRARVAKLEKEII
jgi:hypothetical protein